ncbi:undecaprenyl-diphosphate phosphatase [Couchioplanes caeruleus]|uniref:undecaprenyl-diphosphate phosphatase n=1 Tax=Couchioplanes caeruleus TaxID=56438 RepID=UPI00201C76E3|nr:undecaprenyl-diphosphate phosphatase [Couchioplanes caeruleus]UQU67454.1 undecaprenyl-diphosphate phosphatase [Couchioplanes caeruleus]
MSWIEAVILGLVQGLTEFLPISSSAHLRIVSVLAGWSDPGAAFTAVTQLGTETAVLLYFRRDIGRIVRAWTTSLVRPEARNNPDARLGWYVILGTIPIAVLGLLLQDSIETVFRDLRLTAAALVGFGLVLAFADHAATDRKSLDELRPRSAVLFGLAQALALIPGVSRSGGTIAAGLLMDFRREAAARYSFLLAIPAVLASGLLELTKIGEGNAPPVAATALATVVAFGVGYAVIAWFLRYITHHRFTPFIIYRIAAGILLFALITAGTIDPTAGNG